MRESKNRVQQLVKGRRAGTISLREFKASIEEFSNEELARLAAILLERNPVKRKELKESLLNQLAQRPRN